MLTNWCEWCHTSEAHARRILGIFKKSVSEVESCLGRRRVAFACSRRSRNGCARDGVGGRWKSQNRKNVYLSPYVEEPFNSKVIKSFVTELRNRKCFSCFEIPMFYVYIYIYIYTNIMNVYLPVWICPFHEFISGYRSMILDPSLLNTQHYKLWIKCKVKESRQRSSAPTSAW